ncbi:MAG TPA: pteridine reductase [Gammaproteobacteria bacterium]
MADDTPSLAGHVALLTGAAHRIGAATARRLHGAGMDLVIHYRASVAAAEQLAATLQAERPGSVALLQGDLLDAGGLAGLVARAHAAFGRLDALVNNASSFYPTPLAEATPAQWEELLGSNLRAPFFLAQAALPHLRARRGCIVNIVDIHADRPLLDYPIYSVAKAGLAMLTRVLARELGPEIRVNAVAPGAILWPEAEAALPAEEKAAILQKAVLGRLGDADDIARAVLFFIRDAGYVTGQLLAVDGGQSVVHR